MGSKYGGLDYWRKYFKSTNTDIFEVIEYAINIAASDCPKEFRMRRDRIAERLFSCRLTRCFGCDRVELAVPENEGDDGLKISFDRNADDLDGPEGRETKVNSSTDDHGEILANRVSNYTYDEAEALTDEIEEESQLVAEVLRIKDVLSNSREVSDGVLFESLRRLQLMALSVETLKATEVGKAVNGLRKHGSKQIRHLVRALIEGWKVSVDEWVKAATAIGGTETSPDSVKNPSVADEDEGLPSPPLDGAFLATQTTSMELFQFFDGMDDDGNPQNCGEFDRNRENGRKPISENHNIPKTKLQPLHEENALTKENKGHQIKQTKPSTIDSGPGRPIKLSCNYETKSQQKLDIDKSNCSDEVSVRLKIEATKRKLHEGYQQAENAKKQRTIQVMELHDLPKQGFCHRNPPMRPGTNNQRRR